MCPVFLCRVLFQLYHPVCIRRTAYADLFYEKGQTSDPSHYAGPDDRYHYLQSGSGGDRNCDLAFWQRVSGGIPGPVHVGILPGCRPEYFLRHLYDDPCICTGPGEMDHGKRSEAY